MSASDSKRVAKRRVEWPKALPILLLIALVALLTSAAVKVWRKWPTPGSQTPGTALTGSSGADLFIISSGDTITDFQFGKPKTNKDGDVVIKDGLAAM